MPAANCDLLVIGGGINGAGIARDAAGRGLSVVLVEKGDLGAATSSASSKLIHGGLRYLELYEFRLVAEALAEREILLGIAAHLTSPMRFVMPHVPELRPRWMIRVGLFLYDHLARRSLLPGSQAVRLDAPPYSDGLRPQLRHGFLYSDCAVDDSRLVVANALDARARGARLLVRTELLRARQHLFNVSGFQAICVSSAADALRAAAKALGCCTSNDAGDIPKSREVPRLPAINEAFIPEMFERVNKRLRAIEDQLALLSEKAGVPYDRPGQGVPQEVIDLARAGQTMDAIKKYRELTGAGFQEANDIVTGL